MAAKRKSASPKQTWQALRRRYTWHLRPPFDKTFDRPHWWKGRPDSGIDPVAALYELARRHPLVAEDEPIVAPPELARRHSLVAKEQPIVAPPPPHPSLRWTRWLRMMSWPKLTKSERSSWKASLGKLKGFDFRPKESLCRNITSLTRSAIIQQREEAHKAFADCVPPLSGYPSVYLSWLIDPTDREWEEAIAQYAVEVHRQGYILLGVAPDLAANKAGAIMAAEYRTPLRIYHQAKPRERARWADWLRIIAEFENDEASGAKAKSQVFARYRRALDAIRFA